jgi:hypothetical protein
LPRFIFVLAQAQKTYCKKIADSTSTEAILPDNANLKTINAPDETKNKYSRKTDRYGCAWVLICLN